MENESCISVPRFERLKYFYGQMLGVADLQAEQNYFREKLKLHNRCLHGYGVICGLRVSALPPDRECPPSTGANSGSSPAEPPQPAPAPPAEASAATAPADPKPGCVQIDCGFALDCEGNEIVVRRRVVLDLWKALSRADRESLKANPAPVYLSVCYCEEPSDLVRPVIADACGVVRECAYGRLREGFRITASLEPPLADHRCEPCCQPCVDPCLLLARIDDLAPGKPLQLEQVHNEVRRVVSTYPFTTITGVNWTHGGMYTRDEVSTLMGTDDDTKGLIFRFSRPVIAETLKPGVLDVWVIEGGAGRANNIYNVAGRFQEFTTPTVTEARFYQTSGETFQRADRILIMLRCAFILDECCRPVDGTNTGGLTFDFTRQSDPPRIGRCASPPHRYGPWTSGNGFAPGQTFESWILVRNDKGATS
jgi:hypothetical protein